MDLILLVGPQAVGKMTVGKALENKIDAKLLFNHETLDIFARFLGYTKETFELSDWMRKQLFKAFIENEKTNQTKGIIFTVVVGFDVEEDFDFLREITDMFTNQNGQVYFVELEANIEERLKRNKTELRLQEKPSKRNLVFSENELKSSMEKHRLNSFDGEVEAQLKQVHYLKINNSTLSPEVVAENIQQWISSKKAQK
ncbi:AAA family ATPase [Marinilactibacillus sp. Marseille-P9653]|uniref:AAA family ATPase n=1 Tax=Marinilactibacillus sp. Marseille-P9653 TaxID=2866583 RepID=UPI001CE44B98|nr:AAA family ATPase [Marinilactibacillus sp. Marseille-P9653]